MMMSTAEMNNHHLPYMRRCLQLAGYGAGRVAPNPMVGAVLVHNGRIIGEGYHEQYGQAHAEVNCLNAVVEEDRWLISESVMYVSLEPCAHFGKTPPCADRIIAEKIPEVVIACRDPFRDVNGKGIEKLERAGIQVTTGILDGEARDLNRRFFTYHTLHRPYIILKWAQSADGKIASVNEERTMISGSVSNRLVHRWRSEEAAILVGTHTALLDDPALTTRFWPGRHPLRLVIDKHLRLPLHLKIFDNQASTIVFSHHKQEMVNMVQYHRVNGNENMIQQILQTLYERQILSVIIEGGASTLQSFLEAECWDEARVITNTKMFIGNGLAAPLMNSGSVSQHFQLENDAVTIFRNNA